MNSERVLLLTPPFPVLETQLLVSNETDGAATCVSLAEFRCLDVGACDREQSQISLMSLRSQPSSQWSTGPEPPQSPPPPTAGLMLLCRG